MNNYNSRGGFQGQNRQGGQGQRSDSQQRAGVIPLDFLKNESINISDKGREFVDKIFEKNKYGQPKVTITKIRKFLSAVNSLHNGIEAGQILNKDDVQYLSIKLAYQAGRDKKDESLSRMYYELEPIIRSINTSNEFKKFARLIEAIVAYHKFYGGEN